MNINVLGFIFLPLILMGIIGYLDAGSFNLLIEHLKLNYLFWVFQYLLVALFIVSLTMLNRYLFVVIGYLFTSFLLILTLVNKVKFEIRGEYLYPWDYLLLKETIQIVQSDKTLIPENVVLFLLIGFITLTGIFILLFKKINHVKYGISKKLASTSTILLLVMLILMAIDFKQNQVEQPVTSYSQTGFIYSFYENTKYYFAFSEKYQDYSEQKIDSILAKADEENKSSNQIVDDVQPNVIMVMSEAFWDTKKLENVELNQNPNPFFDSLIEESISGELLVPVYGGSTANTEFEVLTGLTTKFLLPGSVPYTMYLNRPVNSLASVFNNKGYQSTAIHSYHNWFYDRNKVYEQLGFEKFISMEYFGGSQQIGAFIDDTDLFKILLDEMQKSKERDFIYGVTMLNHGGYPDTRFQDYSFEVIGDLSDESKKILRTYVETQKKVDDALKYLISKLENLDEPTILVFFGDHLPMLGEDYLVYRESGYFKGKADNFQQTLDMYTVPYLIWNNYDGVNQENIDLSSNFLGSYLLDQIHIEAEGVLAYNKVLLREGITYLPGEQYYENVGLTKKFKKSLLNDYELLQFDALFGKGFGISENIVAENYIMGKGELAITSSYPVSIKKNELFNEYNGESIIGISGENFTMVSPYFEGGSEIYINGEKQPTVFESENYISAVVPSKFYENVGEIEIQVKVTDSKGTILSQSNVIHVQVH